MFRGYIDVGNLTENDWTLKFKAIQLCVVVLERQTSQEDWTGEVDGRGWERLVVEGSKL